MYADEKAAEKYLQDFHLIITFDKNNSNGSFVASANEFQNPYVFYFCEPILLLFVGDIPEDTRKVFGYYTNNIVEDNEIKIFVNSEFYASFRNIMTKYLAETFMGNAVMNLSKLNRKSYDENLIEFNVEMEKIDINDSERAIKTYHLLLNKYNGFSQ